MGRPLDCGFRRNDEGRRNDGLWSAITLLMMRLWGLSLLVEEVVEDDDGQALDTAEVGVVGDEEGTISAEGCGCMEGVR